MATTAPTQGTAKKLEENPALPTDHQKDLVYVLARLFRTIAQVVNPIVAWVANWQWVTVQNVPPNPQAYTEFTVSGADPTGTANIALNKKGNSTANNLVGRNNGLNRWLLTMGGAETETGSNVGSDFGIYRYNDAGANIDRPFAINRASGIVYSFTGLTVAPPASFGGNAILALCTPGTATGNAATVQGYKGGTANTNLRWQIQPGNGSAESGSNAGSDFGIYRYDDTGAYLGAPFSINRSSGVVALANTLSVAAGGYDVTGNSIVRGNLSVTNGLGVTGASTATANISTSGGCFVAPGTQSAGYGLTTNSFYASGGYQITYLLNAASCGDTANCFAALQPGVLSFFQFAIGGSGNTFQMRNNGVGQSPGGWIAASDIRLKSDISPIADAMAKVRTLGGYTYLREDMAEMDGTVPRKAGYIAQEIQKVLPEAIVYGTDEHKTLAVHDPAVIGLLIEAIKDIDRRLAKLETAVTQH
jgi:hypothetical protein